MYRFHQLIDLLDGEGEMISSAFPQYSDSYVACLTVDTADWLYIVSTALSFQGQGGGLADDLLGFRSEFNLTDGIVQKFLFAIEHSFMQSSKPFIDAIEGVQLRGAIDDVRWSWWDQCNFFERHMHYISILAEEVIWDVHWNSEKILDEDSDEDSDEDMEEDNVHSYDFAQVVIKAFKDTLISTAFGIINEVDYKHDHVYKMDSWDVSILYTLFDLYPYSISVAETDPFKFEKSLQYRAKLDEHPYDCLDGYKELHDMFIYPTPRSKVQAIDDMLYQLSPPVLSRILKNVFPYIEPDRATFLHHLAENHHIAFATLFPYCRELWFVSNNRGLTPMLLFLFRAACYRHLDEYHVPYEGCSSSLDLIFHVVACNPEYFTSLVLK